MGDSRIASAKSRDQLKQFEDEEDCFIQELPLEIIFEILIRVSSASSLWEFRCVCKSWCSLISSKKFIETYLRNSLISSNFSLISTSLLPAAVKTKICPLSSLLADDVSDSIELDCPVMNDDPQIPVPVFCSSNGLCLLLVNQRDFYFWNPFIKKVRKLPDFVDDRDYHEHVDDKRISIHCCAFYFNQVTHDYNVFAFINSSKKTVNTTKIYSFKTDSWKRLDNFEGRLFLGFGKFLNGKVNWLTALGPSPLWYPHSLDFGILSFDLTSELLARSHAPSKLNQNSFPDKLEAYSVLGVHDGCLTVLCLYSTRLWFCVLKDYYGDPVSSWVLVASIPCFRRFWDHSTVPKPSPRVFFVTKEGEILLSQKQTIIIYNTNTKSFRYPWFYDSYSCADICIQSLVSPFPDVMANKTRQTGNNAKQVDSDKNWRRARAIGACPNTRVVIEDVTRGKEKMKIQVVDDTGGEYASPEPFFYISNSVVYKKANLKFTLREIGSDCCGECGDDCMGDDCVCSRLTIREACPYSVGGCLTGSSLDHVLELRNPTNYNLTRNSLMHVCKEAGKKCTGRRIQPFIKECWEGCGCSMKCVNRVVQKGICRKLQVFRTSDSGWVIRALEKLPAGTFGFEYVGEVLKKSELLARIKDNSATVKYSVALDADLDSEMLGDDSKLFYLDATRYSNISKFIRFSTFNEANLIDIPVAIENNHRNYYHVAFFTKVDVDPFIELTWDRRVHSSKKYKVDTAEKIDTRFSSERVVFTRKGKRSKVEGCKYI